MRAYELEPRLDNISSPDSFQPYTEVTEQKAKRSLAVFSVLLAERDLAVLAAEVSVDVLVEDGGGQTARHIRSSLSSTKTTGERISSLPWSVRNSLALLILQTNCLWSSDTSKLTFGVACHFIFLR